MEECPNCGKKLVESEKFFECEDVEGCGYRISKKKVNELKSHWLTKIANDDNLWYKDIFGVDLPFISNEYERLYKLCKEKQSYGMLLEIKDIFEILIKLPTLLVASSIYLTNEYSDDNSKLLVSMLEKRLSLGDWERLAREATNATTNEELKSWLTRIRAIFDDKHITKWRNKEIGHGALSLDTTEDYQKDIKEKLATLQEFFDKNIDSIKKVLNSNIYKKGIETLFFKEVDREIYFFDSYGYKKTSRVDYINGKFYNKPEKELSNLTDTLHIKNRDQALDNRADANTRDASAQEFFEKMQNVDDYVKPLYLEQWIKNNLEQNPKGTLLLQMQRGMGKSIFARALDELALGKIKIDFTLIRAYYVNGVYSHTLGNFCSTLQDNILNKYLDENILKDKLIGEKLDNLSESSKTLKQEFIKMLNFYKDSYNQDKILFIIDGIDEIPKLQKDKKSILDIIPSSDELPDGVFILITSRLEMSKEHQERLNAISFTDKKSVTIEDDSYDKNIKEYIKNKIKIKDKEDVKIIYKRTQKRFVYIKLVKILIDMGLSVDEIPDANKIVEKYLENLKQRYGDKYFQNVLNLLAVLSTAYEKLTLKEIVYMLNQDYISFRLLALLNDSRGFLRVDRSHRGNLISIAHQDIEEYLKESEDTKYAMKNIVSTLVDNITDKDYEVDVENDGESYLLANLYRYALYAKELKEKMRDFIIANFGILDSAEKKQLLLERTISYYSQIIENDFGENHVALAFINKGIAYENLGKLNDALEDHNKAIEILELLDNDPNIHFDRNSLAGAFMNRGVIYRSLNKLQEAIENHNKAIEILELLDNDPNDRNDLAVAFMNRGVVYKDLGKLNEAIEDYDKAIEIQEVLDDDPNIQFDRNDLAKSFMNRGVVYEQRTLDKAIEDYNKVIEIQEAFDSDPNIHFDRNDLAMSFMNRGNAYAKFELIDKLNKAISDYNKAIEIREALDSDPNIHFDRNDLAITLINRGTAHLTLGRLGNAKKDFTKFFEIIVDLIYHHLESGNEEMVDSLYRDNTKDMIFFMENNYITNKEYIQKYKALFVQRQ